MTRKILTKAAILVVVLAAFIGAPMVHAGGVCGGTYVVEAGDTLEKLAAMCGTTVSVITSANPGIGSPLTPGQVITIPGAHYGDSVTPVPATQSSTIVNNYNTYNYNYYTGYPPSGSSAGTTYTVQYGDTFASIAYRFGVTVYALWAANPYIQNINLIYAGQVLNIPASSGTGYPVSYPTAPSSLTYGSVPSNAPMGHVKLVVKTSSDIYVSFQGTAKDGTRVIREYSVDDSMTVKIPAGRYIYVAWVGGIKYSGQFNLGEGSDRTVTFQDKKVTAD